MVRSRPSSSRVSCTNRAPFLESITAPAAWRYRATRRPGPASRRHPAAGRSGRATRRHRRNRQTSDRRPLRSSPASKSRGPPADAAIEKSITAQGAPTPPSAVRRNIIVRVATTVTCNVSGAGRLFARNAPASAFGTGHLLKRLEGDPSRATLARFAGAVFALPSVARSDGVTRRERRLRGERLLRGGSPGRPSRLGVGSFPQRAAGRPGGRPASLLVVPRSVSAPGR